MKGPQRGRDRSDRGTKKRVFTRSPAALAAIEFSRGFQPIGIYTNYVQPNPTGGSRWIVQSQTTRTGKLPRIPPPAGGGWFNPNPCFPLLSSQVGIEPSTTCRWWDSGVFLCVL